MTNLPPRFREKSFRRYEKDLAKAVAAYPTAIVIDPTSYGLSANTIAQRFRDAKHSLSTNAWPSDLINKDKFLAVRDDLIVSETLDGKVRVGPVLPKTPTAEATLVPTPILSGLLKLTPTTPSEWSLLGRLSHERALCRKILLSMSDEQADSMYNAYDVNLEKQNDGSYILT